MVYKTEEFFFLSLRKKVYVAKTSSQTLREIQEPNFSPFVFVEKKQLWSMYQNIRREELLGMKVATKKVEQAVCTVRNLKLYLVD